MNRRGKRRKEVNSHISLQTIKQYLQDGTYPKHCPQKSDKRGIRKRCESFKLEGEDLYYIARPRRLEGEPVDPNPRDNRNNYRKAILTVREQLAVTARAHVGESGLHKGTERTLHGVSSQYYWVGMSAMTRQVVKSCVCCMARQDGSSAYERSIPPKTVPTATSTSDDIQQLLESTETEDKNDEKQESAGVADDVENAAADEAQVTFTVTAEVENPEEEDPALDFDVGAVFSDGKNLMEECDILKAQRFWERVEILVMSPTAENKKKEDGRGRHSKHYTIIALDSFSKWPEAKRLDKINEQTISQFIMQLIARFGVMNQLVILENGLMIEQSVVMSGIIQNLSMFNVIVMSESYNPYDDNWTRISKCVCQFVQNYPTIWSSCLDLCLMPLRNSVAPKNDYTPAFVVTGREPVFPSFLFPHSDSLSGTETVLSQEQIETAISGLMSKYNECSEADVKEPIASSSYGVSMTQMNLSSSLKEEDAGVRRSGRKVTISQRLDGYDHVFPPTTGGAAEEEDEGMSQSVPLKKRKHASLEIDEEEEVENEAPSRIETLDSKKLDGDDVLHQIDSCIFYKILKSFIENGELPLNCPVAVRRCVHNVRGMHSLEDGNLMYCKNRTKKRVLTTMKERLCFLDEVHKSGESHVPKSRMLEQMEKRLVCWKNAVLDLDAYVRACPGCKHSKTRYRTKKKSGKKWQRSSAKYSDDDEDDLGISEKYQDRVSSYYPDLIEFLESGVGPSHLSRSELVVFKKKAKNFKLVRGELFYTSSSSTASKIKGRRVLVNQDQIHEVMRKAHSDTHRAPHLMLAEIKKWYFWRLMAKDVEDFVKNCCQSKFEMRDDNTDEMIPRVQLFAKYFRGEDICNDNVDLDSLFTGSDNASIEMVEGEALDDRKGIFVRKTEDSQVPPGMPANDDNDDDVASKPLCVVSSISGSLPDGQISQIAVAASAEPEAFAASTVDSPLDGSAIPILLVEHSNQISEGGNDGRVQEFQVELREAGKMSELEQGADVEMGEQEDEEEDEDEGEVTEKEDNALSLHSKAKRPHGKKMRCEICQKILRGDNNMKEHMYKHTGVKPFSCEVCNKKLTTVKGMKMHMRKHTGHRPYLCNICGRGFPRSASLRYHIKTHDKGVTMPVICEICDRVFTTEHRMKKHVRFKHPEKRPVWKCDTCGKHFTAKRSLKRHEETHQGIRRYVCEFCNRSFFRKEYLTYHLDSHYKGNPSMAHLTTKRKQRRLNQRQLSGKEDNAGNILSIYTVGPDTGQDKMYTQLVEVTNPHAWADGGTEGPTVFTLEGGTLQVSEGGTIQVAEVVDHPESGTALVMVEEGGATGSGVANHAQGMEIGHIIMARAADVNAQQVQVQVQATGAAPNQLRIALPAAVAQEQSVQLMQNEIALQTTAPTTLTSTPPPPPSSSTETVLTATVPTTQHVIETVVTSHNSSNNSNTVIVNPTILQSHQHQHHDVVMIQEEQETTTTTTTTQLHSIVKHEHEHEDQHHSKEEVVVVEVEEQQLPKQEEEEIEQHHQQQQEAGIGIDNTGTTILTTTIGTTTTTTSSSVEENNNAMISGGGSNSSSGGDTGAATSTISSSIIIPSEDIIHSSAGITGDVNTNNIIVNNSNSNSSGDGIIISNSSHNHHRQIEVTMPNGQKLTLCKTEGDEDGGEGGGGVGGQGGEMVQYRLECLDGETITEEHIRMLAQASSLFQT